jgi:flagellar basal body-associated protein FliL
MRLFAPLIAVALFAIAGPAAASGSSGATQEQAPATRQERLTSAESFMPLPTLSAGILQRNANRGTLVVDMGLDIPDETLRRRALLNAPRLRDALRTALATYASTYYRDRTAPDPTELTRQFQMAINRTLQAEGARVLLVNIIYQRSQN